MTFGSKPNIRHSLDVCLTTVQFSTSHLTRMASRNKRKRDDTSETVTASMSIDKMHRILDTASPVLCRALDVDHTLFCHLLSEKALTQEQIDDCQACGSPYKKAELMIFYLKRSPLSSYAKFRQILSSKEKRDDLVRLYLPEISVKDGDATQLTDNNRSFGSDLQADLRNYIDPDLIDELLKQEVITPEEHERIRTMETSFNMVDELMRCLDRKGGTFRVQQQFMNALNNTEQKHVYNFIYYGGDMSSAVVNIGNDWPLTRSQLRRLDCNRRDLVELIDLRGGLINKLRTDPICITKRHEIHIQSYTNHIAKNGKLIDIMRRRSLDHFYRFLIHMKCSGQPGQHELATFLEAPDGLIVRIKAELNVPIPVDMNNVEQAIVAGLRSATTTNFSNLFSPNARIIGAREGHSVGVYFGIESVDGLDYIRHMYNTHLRLVLERIFNTSVPDHSITISRLVWETDDYRRCAEYFDMNRSGCDTPSWIQAIVQWLPIWVTNWFGGKKTVQEPKTETKPCLGLWLPSGVLSTIMKKSSWLMLTVRQKQAGHSEHKRRRQQVMFTLLAPVCRTWWQIVDKDVSKQIDSTEVRCMAEIQLMRLDDLVVELLQIVLHKAFILVFKENLGIQEGEQLAYKMLAGVSNTWMYTLIGWPSSDTRHWMKHKIRRHVKYLRQQQQQEHIKALNRLVAKHVCNHKRQLERYRIMEDAVKATKMREISQLHDNANLENAMLKGSQSASSDMRLPITGNSLTVLESMKAKRVADDMFHSSTLTHCELKNIQDSETERQAAQKLLSILADQPQAMFDCVLEALRKADQEELYLRYIMSEYDIKTMYSNMHPEDIAYLVDAMDATESGLTAQLVADDHVLSETEKEEVDAEPTLARQNMKLLSVLSRKTAMEFELFIKALDKSDQHHVADRITGQQRDTAMQPPVVKFLVDVSRREQQLKDELVSTKAELESLKDKLDSAAKYVPSSSETQLPLVKLRDDANKHEQLKNELTLTKLQLESMKHQLDYANRSKYVPSLAGHGVPQTFKEAFSGKLRFLSQSIDTKSGLLSLLEDCQLLTTIQRDSIESKATQYERCDEMLRLLQCRNDSDVPKFLTALVATNQRHIVDYIVGYKTSDVEFLPPVPVLQQTRSQDVHRSFISRLRADLRNYVDPDVVDELLRLSVVTPEEHALIRTGKTPFEKTDELMRCLDGKSERLQLRFVHALNETGQKHVANFIYYGGDRCSAGSAVDTVGNEWPLSQQMLLILDCNRCRLVELIDLRGGLIDKLTTDPICITERHRIRIESHTDWFAKNGELIDIMRRRSIEHFYRFLHHIKYSGQPGDRRLESFLEICGLIVQSKVELHVPIRVDVYNVEQGVVGGVWSALTTNLSKLLSPTARIVGARKGH